MQLSPMGGLVYKVEASIYQLPMCLPSERERWGPGKRPGISNAIEGAYALPASGQENQTTEMKHPA